MLSLLYLVIKIQDVPGLHSDIQFFLKDNLNIYYVFFIFPPLVFSADNSVLCYIDCEYNFVRSESNYN